MVKKVLKYYLKVALRYKRNTLTAWALAPFGRIGNDFIAPLVITEIINRVSRPERPEINTLTWLILAFFAVPVVSEIIWRIIIHNLNKSDALAMEYIANQTFKDLANRPYDFHINNFAGALVAKSNRFIRSYEPLADAVVFEFLGTFTATIFAVYVLFRVSWPVAVAFIVILIVFTIITYFLSKKRYKYNTEAAEIESRSTAQLSDSLSNAVTVKTFARELHEVKLFKNINAILRKKRLQSWNYQNMRVDIFTTSVIILINSVALLGSLYAVYRLNAEVGTVFLIMIYIRTLTGNFWNLSRLMRNVEQNISNAVEMMQVLEKDHTVKDVPDAKKIKNVKGDIRFDEVSYAYPDNPENKLFENLCLQIEPGQSVGLVGPSGGGKTTITKLLLRFMDIQKGTIKIDGIDISHVTQKSLRDVITYVPQEPILFHRSLRENIAYGRPDATLEEIMSAAKKANADEFIKDLPKGYDTMVGERGIKLSGGQRQRVAIARAILKNSPIVVFDEATSALDSKSEKLIQKALLKLMEGRTSIVIAHRLSTIKHLDRIIVLENGAIKEDGTHSELIKQDKTYANLWSHQSGGFIE